MDKLLKKLEIMERFQNEEPFVERVNVIKVTQRVGNGDQENPIRKKHHLFTEDGERIVSYES